MLSGAGDPDPIRSAITEKVGRSWHRGSRKSVAAPSLEEHKARLDGAGSTLG